MLRVQRLGFEGLLSPDVREVVGAGGRVDALLLFSIPKAKAKIGP